MLPGVQHFSQQSLRLLRLNLSPGSRFLTLLQDAPFQGPADQKFARGLSQLPFIAGGNLLANLLFPRVLFSSWRDNQSDAVLIYETMIGQMARRF